MIGCPGPAGRAGNQRQHEQPRPPAEPGSAAWGSDASQERAVLAGDLERLGEVGRVGHLDGQGRSLAGYGRSCSGSAGRLGFAVITARPSRRRGRPASVSAPVPAGVDPLAEPGAVPASLCQRFGQLGQHDRAGTSARRLDLPCRDDGAGKRSGGAPDGSRVELGGGRAVPQKRVEASVGPAPGAGRLDHRSLRVVGDLGNGFEQAVDDLARHGPTGRIERRTPEHRTPWLGPKQLQAYADRLEEPVGVTEHLGDHVLAVRPRGEQRVTGEPTSGVPRLVDGDQPGRQSRPTTHAVERALAIRPGGPRRALLTQ